MAVHSKLKADIAVSYGVNVHYQDSDGAWQEIDNRPVLNRSVYTAQNGDALTAYSATLATGDVLTASYGSAAVAMRLLDTEQAQALTSNRIDADDEAQLVTSKLTFNRNAAAQVLQPEAARSEVKSADTGKDWTTEDLIPDGLRSGVVYTDVFPGVDLEYTAYGTDLKEQIVVKQKQDSYRYDFLLTLTGLSSALNKDGSVSLSDSGGKIIYTVPAPYMCDSNGAISTEVPIPLPPFPAVQC